MPTEEQRGSAKSLCVLLRMLLREKTGYTGRVSAAVCEEIIVHHERDLERLHHLHPDGIHPSKHIGYLVFWIRKLKPVSLAFPLAVVDDQAVIEGGQEIPDEEENVHINELLAIYVAQHLTLSYAQDGHICPDLNDSVRRVLIHQIKEITLDVLNAKADVGSGFGSAVRSFIYDMRYRTFGPHHVVHFINHVVYAAEGRATNTNGGEI